MTLVRSQVVSVRLTGSMHMYGRTGTAFMIWEICRADSSGAPDCRQLRGQVVGEGGAVSGIRAFIWTSAAGMQDLGDLPGGLDLSQALDINSNGEVVGVSGAATGDGRAFLWTSVAGMQDLGDLPGGLDFSSAKGINDAGQIVGFGSCFGGRNRGPLDNWWRHAKP